MHRTTLTFDKARDNTLRIGHPDQGTIDLDAIVIREAASASDAPPPSDGRFSTPGGVRGEWIADFVGGELRPLSHAHRLDERTHSEGPPVLVKTPTWCVAPGWCGSGAQFHCERSRD